tara:strand:+ start:349 stop:594 length:246 start_codon:yes stop_codon:yes gene_type:complete
MENNSIQSLDITQEDFELIKGQMKSNIRFFANNKEKIGITFSESQWDYWKSILEWEEVEKIETVVKKTIEIENLRLKEKKN